MVWSYCTCKQSGDALAVVIAVYTRQVVALLWDSFNSIIMLYTLVVHEPGLVNEKP